LSVKLTDSVTADY